MTVLVDLTNFYPVMQGANKGCINDGNEPKYMKKREAFWITTLKSCCSKFFASTYSACMGEPSLEIPFVWYPDYYNQFCIQDCNDNSSHYRGTDDAAYKSAAECCDGSLWWVTPSVCAERSKGQQVGECPKWYVDWNDLKCVMDCIGEEPCGGYAFAEHERYDSKSKCCDDGIPWKAECDSV